MVISNSTQIPTKPNDEIKTLFKVIRLKSRKPRRCYSTFQLMGLLFLDWVPGIRKITSCFLFLFGELASKHNSSLLNHYLEDCFFEISRWDRRPTSSCCLASYFIPRWYFAIQRRVCWSWYFVCISGYLITTIIIEDIKNERFSILSFYERRARRILPALFVMILLCIPFAWMWMLPSQMGDFLLSLVAVSFFASNILFWRESDYFAVAAEEKPLLHTWNLAVEEQWYLAFPIILNLGWRFGRNRMFWMILVTAAVSLALSEWGWRYKDSANFYLAPTRAWELLAGSVAAFIVQKQGVKNSNPLSFLGLAAIILSVDFMTVLRQSQVYMLSFQCLV